MGRHKNFGTKERFWKRVTVRPEIGCWEWPGKIYKNGYGAVRWQGRDSYAHRVSFMTVVGPIRDGLFVLHKCDNRRCVRPDHLFLGTTQDNSVDKATKGRGAHHALTPEDVLSIKDQIAAGGSDVSIAEAFQVSSTTIRSIRKRKTWAWLTEETVTCTTSS